MERHHDSAGRCGNQNVRLPSDKRSENWLWVNGLKLLAKHQMIPCWLPCLMLATIFSLPCSVRCMATTAPDSSALRNVLEVITIATCGSLLAAANSTPVTVLVRQNSASDPLATSLAASLSLIGSNSSMRASGFLRDARDAVLPGGFARSLYRELCNYAHTRPGFAEADLWKSTGPIFASKAFRDWYYAYLRTISICSISILLVGPALIGRRWPSFS